MGAFVLVDKKKRELNASLAQSRQGNVNRRKD